MRSSHPSIAGLAGLLFLTLTACSGPSPESGAADPAPDERAMAVRSAGPAPTYRVPSVHVTRTQLQAGIDLFNSHFRAQGAPIPCDTMEVPWRTLLATLPAVGDGHERALCVHYGLAQRPGTEALVARLGWAWRSMVAVADSNGLHAIDHTDHTTREWNGTRLLQAGEDQWNWDHQLRPDRHAYFDLVQVNRRLPADTADRWEPVNAGDPHGCTLPFEQELQRMYDDNRAEFEGQEEHVYLVLRCTGELRSDAQHNGPYVAHTVTAHLRLRTGGGVRDLLGDDPADPLHPFHLRGADFGNLCPVMCGMVEVR